MYTLQPEHVHHMPKTLSKIILPAVFALAERNTDPVTLLREIVTHLDIQGYAVQLDTTDDGGIEVTLRD